MEQNRLIIDFKPEIPQMIVARPKEESKEVIILRVFKGKEALDIYDQLTGGK